MLKRPDILHTVKNIDPAIAEIMQMANLIADQLAFCATHKRDHNMCPAPGQIQLTWHLIQKFAGD